MSARSQVTLRAHDGGEEEEVTEDHTGSPERLQIQISMDIPMILLGQTSFDFKNPSKAVAGSELTLWT